VSFRSDVNLDAEGLPEVLNQGDLVEQAPPRFPINEEIDIAFVVGLAARYGTEHPNVLGAVQPSQPENMPLLSDKIRARSAAANAP
jgi:hypothetical protein